jgi:hypothetical protein
VTREMYGMGFCIFRHCGKAFIVKHPGRLSFVYTNEDEILALKNLRDIYEERDLKSLPHFMYVSLF